MTKFTGPLYVGRLDSDATAVTIDTSGTATYAGNMVIVGDVQVSGNFPDRTGLGRSVFIRETTVVQSNTAGAPVSLKLPGGSDVLDIYVNVEIPFETAVGATAANVAVSGAAGTSFVSFSVSASTVDYRLGRANAVSYVGASYRNVTATLESHVSIQGSNTAMSLGQAILGVVYSH